MAKSESRTVWSSDQGDLRKREPDRERLKSMPPHEQTVYLHRVSKGRGGSTVTLVKKLVLSDKDMKDLTKKLQSAA